MKLYFKLNTRDYYRFVKHDFLNDGNHIINYIGKFDFIRTCTYNCPIIKTIENLFEGYVIIVIDIDKEPNELLTLVQLEPEYDRTKTLIVELKEYKETAVGLLNKAEEAEKMKCRYVDYFFDKKNSFCNYSPDFKVTMDSHINPNNIRTTMGKILKEMELDMKKNIVYSSNVIKDVKFNGPATIVFWNDGTKTVVKCQENETNDPEKGLAMAIAKKFLSLGTDSNSKWYDQFKKWLPKEEKKKPEVKEYSPSQDFDYDEIVKNSPLAKKKAEEEARQEKIIKFFNEGYPITKIAKAVHTTVYQVKKYINSLTDPEEKKKKATTGRVYRRRTNIEYPEWLSKETCDKILEETKERYAGKYHGLKQLQEFFDKECKIEKILSLYGNGYSMYEIGSIIGTTSYACMRFYNEAIKRNKEESTQEESGE